MDLQEFISIYFRGLVDVYARCFEVKRRIKSHGLILRDAKPNASPLEPPKWQYPKQTHIFKIPVELSKPVQENKETSNLYSLKLWSKIPYRGGVKGSQSRDPMQTHAPTPKETHVALGRRASALRVAWVRLHWI